MKNDPILAESDVVVCGGGTAGVFAAVAAAESGANVLLLERSGFLGGAAVGGLVTPMMSSRLPGGLENSYLARRLSSGKAFDPLKLSMELEKMCLEAGVKLCYDVAVCGAEADAEAGHVSEIRVLTARGIERVVGQAFVDCTGDAALCAFADARYDAGHPATGANQPMSLRFLVGGVDLAAFSAFLERTGQESGLPHTAYGGDGARPLYAAVTNRGEWALKPLFERAEAAGDLTKEDCFYWETFGVPGRPDTLAMNHPEFPGLTDATDPFQLTQVRLLGHAAIARQMRFYRKYFPGCQNAYVSQVAPAVGVRESRRVRTEYVLTGEDVLCFRKFPDRIAQSAYPVDVHGTALKCTTFARDEQRPWFEIPYGCLVPRSFENLLVAGRCAGADFIAQSAIRIQPTCRSMGEATGVAAAMSATRNVPATRLDGSEIARTLAERGARYLI